MRLFLKFVFTEAPAQFLQETKRFARGLLKALRLTGDHQKCFRKILKFFSSIFCLRFSVEKEWFFCCFQLGKNGFQGLRVSLRVFFGAVKLMKFSSPFTLGFPYDIAYLVFFKSSQVFAKHGFAYVYNVGFM